MHVCMCVCVTVCPLCKYYTCKEYTCIAGYIYKNLHIYFFIVGYDKIRWEKNIQGSIHYIYKMEKPKRKWRWNFVFMFQPNSKAYANEMKNASKTKPKYYLTGPSYKQCEWNLFFRNFYWLAKLANDRKILSTTKCIEVS